MNSGISNEVDENYSMISVRVSKDHRVMNVDHEFRINPKFYANLMLALDELSKRNTDTIQDEDGDPELICEAGFEGCDHDDFESMSDECKQQRAEDLGEARMDTYD